MSSAISLPVIARDVPLRSRNTFGIEARAARFVRIDSVEALMALHASPEWRAGPRLVLGGGSNIVLAGDFDGLVVHITIRGRSELDSGDGAWRLRIGAGEIWHEVVEWSLAAGRPGLENLALIPGTAGAAPIQNIGAYGVELAERFEELEAFDTETGRLVVLDRAACGFAYRDSIFKGEARGRYVITALTLALPRPWRPALGYGELKGLNDPSPRQVADAVIAIRGAKLPDPAVLGNAGSFFKNPLVKAEQEAELRGRFPGLVSHRQADGRYYKLAAGWLIDQRGWKGRSLGRAGVHDRQALVLVNRGGASGAEILALAAAIQRDVAEFYGVALELEPAVVGGKMGPGPGYGPDPA